MGLFSDILKMAVFKVANSVMDGVNEVITTQEEQAQHLEELSELYATMDYDTLSEYITEPDVDKNVIAIIKNILNQRSEFVKSLHRATPEEIFSEFDDQELIDYYETLLANEGSQFNEEDAKYLVRVFQQELMSRPMAKRIYAQNKEDYFEDFWYESLETIATGNDVFYDEILKAEAIKELEYRNDIISLTHPDMIEELDNSDFMEIYDLVRSDKTKVSYDEIEKVVDGDADFSKYTLYHEYFGESRNMMLKMCEHELKTNRKYLIEKFLNEYCEEEVEKYSNYSDKKLKLILSFSEMTINDKTLSFEVPEQYDFCDKLIAAMLLKNREEQ